MIWKKNARDLYDGVLRGERVVFTNRERGGRGRYYATTLIYLRPDKSLCDSGWVETEARPTLWGALAVAMRLRRESGAP